MSLADSNKQTAIIEENDFCEVKLGTVMRKIRIERNLTQVQVANALNVTPGYISNVENGRTSMSLKPLVVFARLTQTSLDTLVGLAEGSIPFSDPVPPPDQDIMRIISSLSPENRNNLLKTLRIWFPEPESSPS